LATGTGAMCGLSVSSGSYDWHTLSINDMKAFKNNDR